MGLVKGLRLTAILLVLGLAGQAEAGTCGNGVVDDFTQVSASWDHACGINSSGAVQCWGRNLYGQVLDTPSGTFVQVTGGKTHPCTINSSSTVA